MSEYQYYEFAVLDRPLSKEEQAELRSCSTRATITASSFSNTYHWGDLKGDPYEWMERYFDAHVYSSDMGHCQFILRVPKPLISLKEASQATGFERDRGTYGGSAFSIHDSGQYWLLDWSYTDEDGYDERFQMDEDGPGWMAQLAPLRDELLRGDRRPLYLGWLAALCSEELDDDDLEPPVPPGLQTLTAHSRPWSHSCSLIRICLPLPRPRVKKVPAPIYTRRCWRNGCTTCRLMRCATSFDSS